MEKITINRKEYIELMNEKLKKLQAEDTSYGIKDDWKIIDVGTGYDMVGTGADTPGAGAVLSIIAGGINQDYAVDTKLSKGD